MDRFCTTIRRYNTLKKNLMTRFDDIILLNCDETSIRLQPPPGAIVSGRMPPTHVFPESTYKLGIFIVRKHRYVFF